MFSVKYNRKNFYLRGNTVDFDVFNGIFFKREYDLRIPFGPVKYIVDAGAYIGASTVFFKTRYPEAKILALEPEGSNYELLVKNTSSYDAVIPIRAGLWNKDTNLKIVNSEADKYAFQVEETIDQNIDSITGISLDSILRQHGFPYIDILKIDIEGSEGIIFNNDIIPLIKKIKLIIIELHDLINPGSSKAFFKTLNSINYDLTVSGENLIICNKSFTLI